MQMSTPPDDDRILNCCAVAAALFPRAFASASPKASRGAGAQAALADWAGKDSQIGWIAKESWHSTHKLATPSCEGGGVVGSPPPPSPCRAPAQPPPALDLLHREVAGAWPPRGLPLLLEKGPRRRLAWLAVGPRTQSTPPRSGRFTPLGVSFRRAISCVAVTEGVGRFVCWPKPGLSPPAPHPSLVRVLPRL
jgi:hypothetical protein